MEARVFRVAFKDISVLNIVAVDKTVIMVGESEVALLKERAEKSGLRKSSRPWMRYRIQSILLQADKANSPA